MTSDSSPTAAGGKGRRARAVAIVFVTCACGWFVMELEILGGRVLTPYFGSAVYVVMGSVIGVFLLSLSGGYILGGWLSRTPHSKRALGMSLLAAGAWVCVVPFLIEPVCDGILELGLDEKWGSLLASFALFGVPTALLGTVSPTAVQWLTREASRSGLNAGLVLAFSTIASFAGCLVTAFYLVLLSARGTLWVSGALLLAVGGVVLGHALVRGEGERPAGGQASRTNLC